MSKENEKKSLYPLPPGYAITLVETGWNKRKTEWNERDLELASIDSLKRKRWEEYVGYEKSIKARRFYTGCSMVLGLIGPIAFLSTRQPISLVFSGMGIFPLARAALFSIERTRHKKNAIALDKTIVLKTHDPSQTMEKFREQTMETLVKEGYCRKTDGGDYDFNGGPI